MLIRKLAIFLGSFAFAGYVPFAPGTFTSLVVLLIIYFICISNAVFLFSIAVILFFIGVFVSSILEKEWGKDPSKVVIDEAVGILLSLLFLPKTYLIWGIAFLIFRFFDIAKPYPLKKLEKLRGGWGIMMDDVVAGVYTSVLMNIIVHLFRFV